MKTSAIVQGLAALVLIIAGSRGAAAPINLVSDDRSITLTGSYLGQPINVVQKPSSPFDPTLSLVGGGFAFTQTATFGSDFISLNGAFSVQIPVGIEANEAALSRFDVAFRVDSVTPFTFSAVREQGLFGVTGISGIVTWPAPASGLFDGDTLDVSGVLAPGVHHIIVTTSAGIVTTPPRVPPSTTGSFGFSFVVGVPDLGSTLALFLVALAFLFGAHRGINVVARRPGA